MWHNSFYVRDWQGKLEGPDWMSQSWWQKLPKSCKACWMNMPGILAIKHWMSWSPIIYFIGPDTRNVKEGRDADKNWRIRITEAVTAEQVAAVVASDIAGMVDPAMANDRKKVINRNLSGAIARHWGQTKDGTLLKTTGKLIISTSQNGNAPTAQPVLQSGNILLLTVKQLVTCPPALWASRQSFGRLLVALKATALSNTRVRVQ